MAKAKKKNAPSPSAAVQDLIDFVICNPHAPSVVSELDLDSFVSVIETKRKARTEGIERIKSAGKEHIVAAMEWDMRGAPETTNRKQLAEVGIELPDYDPSMSDDAVTKHLWTAINGLAVLGVFFAGTNHLDDRRFYQLLTTRILVEKVSDVPPNKDMSEFIDLTPCKASDDDDSIAQPAESYDFDRDSFLPRPNRELKLQSA